MFFVLSPPQTGGSPSEHVRPSEDGSIARQEQEPAGTALVFPDYVDGGGWSVQLVLSNVDPHAAAEVVVQVYDPNGRPIQDLFDSDLTLEIPALGSRVLRSAGAGALRRGWIRIETDAGAVSGLLTYRHGETGIEVGVEPAQLGKRFALFVEESETTGAGLALFKPEESSMIELRLRNEEGNDPLAGIYVPWGNFQQRARTLPEWFDVPGVDTVSLKDFRGLLFLRAADDSQFAPLGLRFGKQTSSLSAVPVIRIPEGGGIDGGHAPPPTVMLSVAPDSIDWGQSTTLSWSSTNAESVEIEPDIGEVSTSGTRKVSPKVTTTYRITVTGADGQTATALVTVTVAVSERAALEALYRATDGPRWTNADNWLTAAPLEDWYGINMDAHGQIVRLDLAYNALVGSIPPEIGHLSSLKEMYLDANALSGMIPSELGKLSKLEWLRLGHSELTGAIPESFLQLDRLKHFHFEMTAGLCAPGITDFVTWLQGIQDLYAGPYCNQSDATILEHLYRGSGGQDWTHSSRWLETPALGEWHGVTTDSLGRVVTLDLAHNGLAGELTADLGNLAKLTSLRISGNAILGRLPLSLVRLSLVEFHYDDTGLCAPTDAPFRTWLNGIKSKRGTGRECAPLPGREALATLYEATDGPNWTNADNWLTDAPLEEWYGVSTDAQGRVSRLVLENNALTGPIPSELGSLDGLEVLDLGGNALTGSIPPELGGLERLTVLGLWSNSLSGPIPSELGSLDGLEVLDLGGNALTGSIPPELDNLSTLDSLFLDNNHLTGPVPPQLGDMLRLRVLSLGNNPGLSGVLPTSLTNLHLEALVAGDTSLCAPPDPAFQDWYEGVWKRRVRPCGDLPPVYLTQAVQSLSYPVPLIAGKEALMRVFITTAHADVQRIPPVRARFYINGTQKHLVDIPGGSAPIPAQVEEGSLATSVSAPVPADVVQPGLELVVEIDPDDTLGPSPSLAKRIPESGRLPIDVQAMSIFDLTLIPFLWQSNPDRSVLGLVRSMSGDPEGHELLQDTRTLLPIGGLEVTAHDPVLVSSNDPEDLLSETEMIRAMEGARGYYMGMMSGDTSGPVRGIAYLPGTSSFSVPDGNVIAHELGHNLNLAHAPCGGAAEPDRSFPRTDGTVGAWGYDFREGGRIVLPDRFDLMSYCLPAWISDFHFSNAARFRAQTAAAGEPESRATAPVRSLLLWGGVSSNGDSFLEPAFVVNAPALLPQSGGDHEIVGRAADGDELFSLTFQIPKVADGDGRSSFAFVLPVQPGWAGSLASITLSGPGGSVTLDGNTDLPMTILFDPSTGQVRGILRDTTRPDTVRAFSTAPAVQPGFEVLFSRGIPDGADWNR